MGIVRDLTGQRFGRLIAIERVGSNSRGNAVWKCLCDCGNEKLIVSPSLVSGASKSCGCLSNVRDLLGQRFGRLSVISFEGLNCRGGAQWRCICDCGTTKTIQSGSLTSKRILSCGCHKSELVSKRSAERNFRHGRTGTKTYIVWKSMKSRCYRPRCEQYPNYGGRGIKVCDRWLNSFENFLTDMGEVPDGMTLERNNVDGDYTPENCRWASVREQQNNRRNNIFYTYLGKTQTVAEWARETGINVATFRYRLIRGWTIEKALLTPVKNVKGNNR